MYAKSIYVSHILQDMGWKYAFVVTAMPGVLVLLVGFIRFPKPGESDSRDGDPVKLTAPPSKFSFCIILSFAAIVETLKTVLRSPSYMFALSGNVLFAFGKGLIADWNATYFVRMHGLSVYHTCFYKTRSFCIPSCSSFCYVCHCWRHSR